MRPMIGPCSVFNYNTSEQLYSMINDASSSVSIIDLMIGVMVWGRITCRIVPNAPCPFIIETGDYPDKICSHRLIC